MRRWFSRITIVVMLCVLLLPLPSVTAHAAMFYYLNVPATYDFGMVLPFDDQDRAVIDNSWFVLCFLSSGQERIRVFVRSTVPTNFIKTPPGNSRRQMPIGRLGFWNGQGAEIYQPLSFTSRIPVCAWIPVPRGFYNTISIPVHMRLNLQGNEEAAAYTVPVEVTAVQSLP